MSLSDFFLVIYAIYYSMQFMISRLIQERKGFISGNMPDDDDEGEEDQDGHEEQKGHN